MAGDGKSLKFELVVGADGLVEGLKVASKGVDGAAQEIKTSLNGIGGAAHEGATPLSSFTDVIKEYRSEIKQEGRISRFLAADIASMGLSSKSAAGEVTAFIGAFAIGGGMGIAIEGVKILIKTISEVGEEEKKQAEAVKKLGKEVAESVAESMRKVRESFESKSATQTAWEAEGEKVRKKVKEIQEQIDELVQHGGGVRDLMHSLTTGADGKNDLFTVEGTEDKIAKLQAQQKALVDTYARAKPDRDSTQGAEDAHKAEEQAKKDEKVEEQHNATMLGLQAELLDGEDKLRLEFEAKKQQIRDNEQLTEEQQNDQILAQQMVLDSKIAKLKDDRRKKEAADEQAFIDQITKNEQADLKKRDDYEEHSFEAMAKVKRQLAEEDKRRLGEAMANAEKLGASFADAFSSMIDGSESFTQAMVSMGKEVIKVILDIATKSIMASALKAGGEAATAEAGIPIVGPALAVGAMTAMIGTVMGLMSSLPSASGGFDIPGGVNPLTQLHEKEMVLPAHIAEPLRQNLAGGGGLGGDVHMHVTAMDAGSFREWLSRPSTQTELVRSLAEMRKRGRI